MPHVANPLSIIFNTYLNQGIFPDLFKIVRVISIFKNGYINDPKNYPPISLLPNFYKILEQLIVLRLLLFFKRHKIYVHPYLVLFKPVCNYYYF